MSEPKTKQESCLTKILVSFGVLVGIIILAVIFGKASDSSKTSPSSNQTKTETKKGYVIGETVSMKDHQLVVSNLNADYQSGNLYDKPQGSDNVFVVMDVAITNIGSKDLLVNDWGFKLEDETGAQRNTSWFSGVEGSLQSVTLSPNGKTSGKLSFEAKKDSSKLILHYSGGIASGGEITIKLK